MQEEIQALREMVQTLKAKADRYEAVLAAVTSGPLSPTPDGRQKEESEEFEERVIALAKAALCENP